MFPEILQLTKGVIPKVNYSALKSPIDSYKPHMQLLAKFQAAIPF